MRKVTQFIPSSLETCGPSLEGAYVCTPANHVARGCVRPVCISNGGRARTRPVAMRAPLPCSPLGCIRPYERARPLHRAHPSTVCALGRGRPCCRARPCYCACPYYRACPNTICAPRGVRAHKSRSRPTPYTPLQYKFIKIVVHSTTWASRPSTTMKWMTAGYLDSDHSFLIHSHGHIYGRSCMHV
jgi:hypothetical protein